MNSTATLAAAVSTHSLPGAPLRHRTTHMCRKEEGKREAEAEGGKGNYEPWSYTVHGLMLFLKDRIKYL